MLSNILPGLVSPCLIAKDKLIFYTISERLDSGPEKDNLIGFDLVSTCCRRSPHALEKLRKRAR